MSDPLSLSELNTYTIFVRQETPSTSIVVRPVRVWAGDEFIGYDLAEFKMLVDLDGIKYSMVLTRPDLRIEPPLTPQKWAEAVAKYAVKLEPEVGSQLLERLATWTTESNGKEEQR